MSEGLTPANPEVCFPDVPADEAAHERYYADAIEKIKSGEEVWVQRTFDSDSGRVLDMFSDKKYRGYVDQEYDDMACDVYIVQGEETDGDMKRLNHQRVSFDYGVRLLRTAVEAGPTRPSAPSYGYRGH